MAVYILISVNKDLQSTFSENYFLNQESCKDFIIFQGLSMLSDSTKPKKATKIWIFVLVKERFLISVSLQLWKSEIVFTARQKFRISNSSSQRFLGLYRIELHWEKLRKWNIFSRLLICCKYRYIYLNFQPLNRYQTVETF